MICHICNEKTINKHDFLLHISINHLQRRSNQHSSEGLCFCGAWTDRFEMHCRYHHKSMTIYAIAHAVALNINPN
jgi:hypothetical protein